MVSTPSATGVEIEAAGQRQDGAGDGDIFGIVGHAADKCAVDFGIVDREAFEISERGIPGAEIIETDTHAAAVETREGFEHRLGMLHGHALFR